MLQTSGMDTPVFAAAPSLAPELCHLAFRRARVFGRIDFPGGEGVLQDRGIIDHYGAFRMNVLAIAGGAASVGVSRGVKG